MAITDKEYDEKRNFIRMFVNAKVDITDIESGNKYEAIGKNLSGDGAMFNTTDKFTINQKLKINICPAEGATQSLTADFEVKRIQENADGSYDIAGTMVHVH